MNDHVVDLSYALLREVLDQEGWTYLEGDALALAFEDADFLVAINGDILVVSGLIDAPHATAEQVDDLIDSWHRERPWPTCRREAAEDGSVQVVTEVAGYYPSGLSAGQARTHLRSAVGSTQALVARLAI